MFVEKKNGLNKCMILISNKSSPVNIKKTFYFLLKIIYEKKLKHSYFSNLYMNKKLQGTSFGF